MIKIGDFSRLSSTSVRMLRHYAKLKLLLPAKTDENTGYRYYSVEQLDTINKILKFRELGFSLIVIKEILDNKEDTSFIKKYLEARERELEEEKYKLSTQMSLIENISEVLEQKEELNMYSVKLKKLPKRKMVSFRGNIPSYSEEAKLWEELFKGIEKNKIKLSENSVSMAIFHDNEFKEKDVDVEVQVQVDESYKDLKGIKFLEEEEIEVASTTFRGSYEQMTNVSKEVASWMESSGYEMNGAMINIYHVSPSQDSNPDNWVTESCYSVRKKK